MNVEPQIALAFQTTFARAEYSLKGVRPYCSGAEGGDASANWDRFANDIATDLLANVDTQIVRFLVDAPPMKEIVRGGVAVFDPAVLQGTDAQKLLLAVRRVRNNLFHGGKEHRERYAGHDQELVEAALEVIRIAVGCQHEVRARYYS